MACGGSAYKAVEMMEEALKADDVKSTLIKQVRQKSTGRDTSSIADKRAAELKRRSDAGEPLAHPDDKERQEALEALAQGEQEQRLEEDGDEVKTQWKGEEILDHPSFEKLPDDYRNAYGPDRVSIKLPSLDGGHSSSIANHKGHVMDWVQTFTKRFNEEPVVDGEFNVLNDSFVERDEEKLKAIGKWLGKNTDEAVVAGASVDGGSSGPVIGKAAGPIYRTNVVEDELDVEIDTETQEVLKSVVDLLDSEFAHNITPDELIAKKETIDKLLSLLDNFETLPHGFNELKDEVTKLYLYADNPEAFENYIGQLKIVNDYIKALGRNLFSEGELDEATTTDSMSYHDKQFSKDKFYYPKDAEGPKMKNGKLVREERNEQTRYVAEMDFYLWANDDEGAKVEAQRMASEMDSKYDNQPRIQKLFRQPFATMGSQEVPLNENEKTNTQWKGGSFVKIKDKCKKFPYCDAGADAIETKKTKDAVISNDHIIQEISNKTGKSIDEVTTILENFGNRQALQCLEVCKHTNSIIEANPNTIVEFEDEGSRFLAIFEPLEINEEELYIIQRFKYSQDGQNWRDERRSRKLTDPLWNNLFGYDVQTSDCKLIQAGIDNAKDGMATDLETLRPINKEIS
jgi:hypothetical protein